MTHMIYSDGVRKISKFVLVAFVIVCASCSSALAQAPAFRLLKPTVESSSLVSSGPTPAWSEHKFLDKKNRVLFAAVAALSVADFAVTRANLQSGGKELNPVVRVFGSSTPGLAANFAGETVGIIGCSYLFHKTGHHKLERFTSFVNISVSASAVTYGLTHR
jgi:hypothetical protein